MSSRHQAEGGLPDAARIYPRPGTPSAATRILLAAGIAAGPVYVAVALVEAFTRSGFDLTRHSLSLLTNGDLGWIHMAMMVTTGLLTIKPAPSPTALAHLAAALAVAGGRSWSESTVPAWSPRAC